MSGRNGVAVCVVRTVSDKKHEREPLLQKTCIGGESSGNPNGAVGASSIVWGRKCANTILGRNMGYWEEVLFHSWG